MDIHPARNAVPRPKRLDVWVDAVAEATPAGHPLDVWADVVAEVEPPEPAAAAVEDAVELEAEVEVEVESKRVQVLGGCDLAVLASLQR